jgi:hypothetical protein
MRSIWRRAAVAAVVAGALAGCSNPQQHDAGVRAADNPNFLAGCGPLPDQVIARAVDASSVRQQTAPTICTWTAGTAGTTTVDLTYSWLPNDTLGREVQIAGQQDYQVEKFVVKRFGGFYWHNPHDPGSCGATAADTGTVTWWVQNRSHTTSPDDPCAAAMTLLQQTLLIDGT